MEYGFSKAPSVRVQQENGLIVFDEFHVSDKTEMYNKLEAAVASACEVAQADRTGGVLVTRHDFTHFSVA